MEQKRKDNAETQSARRIAEKKKQEYGQEVFWRWIVRAHLSRKVGHPQVLS